MTMDDYEISGIGVVEECSEAVTYSIVLGPIYFRWKILRFTGPKALELLQLLIP